MMTSYSTHISDNYMSNQLEDKLKLNSYKSLRSLN